MIWAWPSNSAGCSRARPTWCGCCGPGVALGSRRLPEPLLLDLRHREDVETAVELRLGQLLGNQPAVDHRLADRLALFERLLRDGGGLLVADRGIQWRHDRGRRLRERLEVIGVGDQARDALVGEQSGDVG